MPLFHCDKCDHEWEGMVKDTFCSWCGGGNYVLQETTALEDPAFFTHLREAIEAFKRLRSKGDYY